MSEALENIPAKVRVVPANLVRPLSIPSTLNVSANRLNKSGSTAYQLEDG